MTAQHNSGTAARVRFWLLTLLNAGAVVTLVFVVLDRSPATRFPIADYGAFYGSLLLFVLIPLGLLGALLLTLISRRPSAKGSRAYFAASAVFLAAAWLMTNAPATFLIGIWQPWPLSLKQGPDTDYARAGFKTLFGQEAPPSVRGLYYRRVGLMGEATHHSRFRFADQVVVENIVERLDLVQVSAEARAGALLGFVRVSGAPASWWRAERINAAQAVYLDRDTWAFAHGELRGSQIIAVSRILWLDEAGQTVFYREHRE